MRILFVSLLPLLLWGSVLSTGDRIVSQDISDQHGNGHMTGQYRIWVITWDRQTTRTANRYFETHPGMLSEGKVAMIVDVSQTPEGILSLFVMPRMRSYAHPILLSFDELFNRKLPYREGMLTVLSFQDKTISAIEFAEDETALDALLRGKIHN